MFEQVAREREIDTGVRQEIKLGHAGDHGLDPWSQMLRKTLPLVQRDSPARHDLVDEVAVAATEVQDAVLTSNQPAEMVLPQRTPDDISFRIGGQARLMVL